MVHGSGDSFNRASPQYRIGGEFRGKQYGLETIFYKWPRNELVHEGEPPTDIKFMDVADLEMLSIRAGGAPDYILLLSPLDAIPYHAVVSAPVNEPVFKWREKWLEQARCACSTRANRAVTSAPR
jgi:hypothetical protein